MVPKDVTKCDKIETCCQKEGPCSPSFSLGMVPCHRVCTPSPQSCCGLPSGVEGRRGCNPRVSGKASLIAKSRADSSDLCAILLCACPSKAPGCGHNLGFAGAWGWRSPCPWSLYLACSPRWHIHGSQPMAAMTQSIPSLPAGCPWLRTWWLRKKRSLLKNSVTSIMVGQEVRDSWKYGQRMCGSVSKELPGLPCSPSQMLYEGGQACPSPHHLCTRPPRLGQPPP